MNKRALAVFLIYLFVSLSLYISWSRRGWYPITNDEPHYLITASGIGKHGVFEQTVPYKEEFATKAIYNPGFATPEPPTGTLAIRGPHGIYSAHIIGLPLLLTLPFLLGGVVGAKLFMILLGGMASIVVWKISSLFGADEKARFYITLSTCVALPVITAANQIVPDMPAGIISLSGIYWFMTTNKRRSLAEELFWICTIVFLPWLHIKFAATCLLLVIALLARIYLESKDFKRLFLIFAPAVLSCALLGFYNYYAFGRCFGPYQSEALQMNKTALMVFCGLICDQNQGFLLQNPMLLVGLFSIGMLFSYNKPTAFLWLLVFLSLIIPNAMHPCWYGDGGGSVPGKFEWAATIVFFLPAVLGLAGLAKLNMKSFRLVVWLSLLLQICFYYQYLLTKTDSFFRLPAVWLSDYSICYLSVYAWMPAFYNVAWVFSYLPNYAWMISIALIVTLGFAVAFRKEKYSAKFVAVTLAVCFSIIFGSGFVGTRVDRGRIFLGKDLPSLTGRIQGSDRVATQGVDAPGFVTFGPYFPLRKGSYQVEVHYSSNAGKEQQIGKWDICKTSSAIKSVQIAKCPLYGTNGKTEVVVTKFVINNWKPQSFEFRNYWDGSSEIQIHSIEIKSL